jgi:hypothetical protein
MPSAPPPPPSPPTPAAAAPRLACANCGEPFGAQGELRRRFCPACGQETTITPPTLGEFAQQFGGAYFSTEGALWRTLKLLLLKPGELTAQYLAGRRKHYVLPLRLYLTISVLVLLAVRLVAEVQIQAPDAVQGKPPDMGSVVINIGVGRAGLKDGQFFCTNLPAWLCKRIQRRLDIKPEAFVDTVRSVSERFVGNLGASLFLVLPCFALGLKLVHLNRRMRFTEHLVFALHVHAFWFLMIGLTLLPLDALKVVALLAVPVYTLLAMRRVYGGRWWALLLRAGVVSVLYLWALLAAMVGVALWSFLS